MKRSMTIFKNGLVIYLLVLLCNSICLAQDSAEVEIWYGNLDGSPIVASIGEYLYIDVYARTGQDVYLSNMALVLGTNDLYIDQLLSEQYNLFYPPLSNWGDILFLYPNHSPPNLSGWSSETFLGFQTDYARPLHLTNPTRILTMVMLTANDSGFCGNVVNAFGVGVNQYVGVSSAGDTVGGPGYVVTEHYCPLLFLPQCSYTLGDINGDGHPIGGDVTYAVRYFKSQGPPPVDSCYMDSTGSWFYPAGDVNGNCEFRGSDITRMVAYFKSTASLSYCHFFPPVDTGRR